jgi:hypothetical protein
MYFRLLVLFCLILNLVSAASAQQSKSRIDLSDAPPSLEGAPTPDAVSGIVFRAADTACPEEHGTIEIRAGQMFLSRINSRNKARSSTLLVKEPVHLSDNNRPLDDETYQYEIGNEECRLVLLVRLQTQYDGEWRPVSLPYLSRPSVSREERSAFMRGMLNFMKERRENGKSGAQPQPPQQPGWQMLGDVGVVHEGFFFEALSKATLSNCFQAVGAYELGQEGVFFTFMRGLPGNVNRFAIERNDINGYQGRLYFVQGDCRFQVTASGSRKFNSDWAPLLIDNPI